MTPARELSPAEPVSLAVNRKPDGSARIATLDCLRGIAAVAVCLYHFTNGNGQFLPAGWLKAAGSAGAYGVPMFFVISGFVLPLAMHRAGYTQASFGPFVLKRLLRLEPPYLAAIALTLAVGYAAAQLTGAGRAWPELSAPQLLWHLGYLCAFAGHDWINPVFWTLAIEFQFYLLVGLCFPVVFALPRWSGLAGLLGLGGLAFVFPQPDLIFHHWFLFLVGMLAFFFREKLMNRSQLLVLLGACLVGGSLAMDLTVMLVAAGTAGAIIWWTTQNRWLLFFGKISYSLYLVHVPIGMKIVNLSMRWPLELGAKLGVIALALAGSTVVAYALWRWVEQPAQRWSAAVHYRPKPSPAGA